MLGFGKKKNRFKDREHWVNQFWSRFELEYYRECYYSLVAECWNCTGIFNMCIEHGISIDLVDCSRCGIKSLRVLDSGELEKKKIKVPGLNLPDLSSAEKKNIQKKVDSAMKDTESKGLVTRGHIIGED